MLRVHQWHTEAKRGDGEKEEEEDEEEGWKHRCPVLWVDEETTRVSSVCASPPPPSPDELSSDETTRVLGDEDTDVHVFTSSDQVFTLLLLLACFVKTFL